MLDLLRQHRRIVPVSRSAADDLAGVLVPAVGRMGKDLRHIHFVVSPRLGIGEFYRIAPGFMPGREFHQHEVRETPPVHIHQSDPHGLPFYGAGFPFQPHTGYGCIFGIRLDTDVMPPEPSGDHGGRTAAQKRVEYHASGRTPRLDGRFHEFRRIGGVVHLVVILACDPPYRPLVPTLRIDLFHSCRTTVFPVPFALGSFDIEASFVTPTGGFGIRLELLSEVVFRGFREEEHLLEIHREAVFHGGRNDRGYYGRL